MPSSATMNGTRCAIRPAMKATSRDRRSSLATTTGHFAVRRCRERGGKLRPAIQGVGSLARFDLDELGDLGEVFALCEPCDGGSLRLNAEA